MVMGAEGKKGLKMGDFGRFEARSGDFGGFWGAVSGMGPELTQAGGGRRPALTGLEDRYS
jgi:hypothetical protein